MIVDNGDGTFSIKPPYSFEKQEPVAWMSNGKEFYVQKNHCPDFIPLYAHPAKTITDEEIWELHQEHIDEVTCGHSMKTVGFIEFARAILKKASEE